jgi:hypothetical protein
MFGIVAALPEQPGYGHEYVSTVICGVFSIGCILAFAHEAAALARFLDVRNSFVVGMNRIGSFISREDIKRKKEVLDWLSLLFGISVWGVLELLIKLVVHAVRAH